MKRIGVLSISTFFILLVAPRAGAAQSTTAKSAEPAKSDSKSATEATVTKKETKDPLYGLNFSYGMALGTKLNFEPDNASVSMNYTFKIGWNFGKAFKAIEKTWAKHFSASLSFGFGHQVYGFSSLYRSPYPDSDFRYIDAENLALGDNGYFVGTRGRVPRTQGGAPKVARFGDMRLTIAHAKLFEIPKAKIPFSALVRLIFPTSDSTRNSSLYTALTIGLGASRTFKWKVGKVKQSFTIGYNFGFTKYFHKFKNPNIEKLDEPFEINGQTINDPLVYQTATRNPTFGVSNDFSVSYGFYKGFSLSIGYSIINYRTYKYTQCEYQYDPNDPLATIDLCEQSREFIPKFNRRGERDFHSFAATLAYKPVKYLGLTLGLYTLTPQRHFDSKSYRQPFLVTNRNGFSTLTLTATLYVDQLYKRYAPKSKVAEKKKNKENKNKTLAIVR